MSHVELLTSVDKTTGFKVRAVVSARCFGFPAVIVLLLRKLLRLAWFRRSVLTLVEVVCTSWL